MNPEIKDTARPEVTLAAPTLRNEELAAQLTSLCQKHAIPLSEYGTGRWKTFEHLVREVGEGEARIVEPEGGGLLRIGTVLRIDVRHCPFVGVELQLFEEKQVFHDGRPPRVRNTPFAVWEKLKPGEEPDNAVARAVREELDIEGTLSVQQGGSRTVEEPPLDFPGIPSTLTSFDYLVYLSSEQFVPTGYVEHQDDKSTFFKWRVAPVSDPA